MRDWSPFWVVESSRSLRVVVEEEEAVVLRAVMVVAVDRLVVEAVAESAEGSLEVEQRAASQGHTMEAHHQQGEAYPEAEELEVVEEEEVSLWGLPLDNRRPR